MAAFTCTTLVGQRQIEVSIKDVFKHLTTNKPLSDINKVGKLYKLLYGNQCLQKQIGDIKGNPLNILEKIRDTLRNDRKTWITLKAWLYVERSAQLPKVLIREEIEGIKMCLLQMEDKTESSDLKLNNWLQELHKELIITDGDEIPTRFLVLYSLFKVAKYSELQTVSQVDTWEDLKRDLKTYMVQHKAKHQQQVLDECGVNDTDWNAYVRNESFTNTIAVCLPYAAKMLATNLRIYLFPMEQEVNFCTNDALDARVEMCLHKGEFLPIKPFSSNEMRAQIQSLKSEIVILKDRITYLDNKLRKLRDNQEKERAKLRQEKDEMENELNIKKQKCGDLENMLVEAEEEKKQAILTTAKQVANEVAERVATAVIAQYERQYERPNAENSSDSAE